MNIEPIQFAQLLASRICHDLISPVSAVNNGLELLLENDDDEQSRLRALELVNDSARITANKLTLMRAAFGSGQTMADQSSKSDLIALFNDIAQKNKIEVLWDDSNSQMFDQTQSRIILNILLILLEAMPRGGMIEIETDNRMRFSLKSEKLFFSDEKIAYLTRSERVPLEPRHIGFYVLQSLAPNHRFVVEKNNNSIIVAIFN